MRFKVTDDISEKDLKRGLNSIVVDGVMSHLMGVLTGGIFLVAIAVKLGASNFQIGLLAAIPPLVQIVQLPAIFIINKVRSRKTVAIYSGVLARLCFLVIALSPFIFAPSIGLPVLLGVVLLSSALGGIGGCAWNAWMRDVVPEKMMGTFFSNRMRIATFLGIFVSLAAGIFLDYWKKAFPNVEIYAYSLLFFSGFVLGTIGVLFLTRVPETPMALEKTSFLSVLKQPFLDPNFKRLMFALGSWSFAVNLAAPFFTVYMMTKLEYGISMIVVFSIISQACNFAFLGLWGKWADKFSNKSVLAVSGPLFMFSIILWTFTTMPEKHAFTLPLLVLIHIIMGISTAGVAIASGNISLKLAPRGRATAYLATNSLVISFAAGIAPVLGGKFADFFTNQNLSLALKWTAPGQEVVLQALNFQHWDFFFALAFIIGLYALHRIALVHEEGEVDDKVVRTEFMSVISRPIRSLSSAAGLFQIITYPFSAIGKSLKGKGKSVKA